MKINWRHPLTLLLIASVLGGLGWAVRTYVFARHVDPSLDQSALRAEIQRPEQISAPSTAPAAALTPAAVLGSTPVQAIGLASSQPSFQGQTLYCDTVKVTLVLAHNQGGEHPLLITNLVMRAEPVRGALTNPCEIDPLSSRPAGIAERNVYLLTLNASGVSGTYLRSGRADDAWPVSAANLLVSERGAISVSLRPGEEPVAFDFFVTSQEPGVKRIWFEAMYDANGQRVARTEPVLLGGAAP